MSTGIVTEHPLQHGSPPLWADEWGHDAWGPWCRFQVQNVWQRLRWIPSGQFLMGSVVAPDSYWIEETPQHLVRITQGFWLFDGPCPQELWEAVGMSNQSHFRGPQLPVERVSFSEVTEFIDRLTEVMEGMFCRLPTEAEWEYSCRAGTTGERYGDLDAIAWHLGNSSGRTHEVRGKQCNPWGLYDMIGNVWEWCSDSPRKYSSRPEVDPFGQGSRRVLRGGSWDYGASDCRSAFRCWNTPGSRRDFLGFRVAVVPASESPEASVVE
jgi:formylglycine-generating enzyme required for sulfatase activity